MEDWNNYTVESVFENDKSGSMTVAIMLCYIIFIKLVHLMARVTILPVEIHSNSN